MQANTHFMTAKEASKNWGISQRRVATLCSEGRVENATILGNMWLLPITAMKPDDARYLQKKDLVAKPFLKWAGGKGQLLTEISNRLPEGLGGTINKYAEPFIGGGALLFDILQNYDISEVYINDVNVALISAYRQVKYNVDELIKSLKTLQDEFIGLATEARKEYYYGKRTRFNTLVTGREKNEEELAALMIFINKTCFNGLYRVNRKGEYNVPMGDYKNPKICDDSNLLIISKLLQNVDINIGSYKEVLKFADQNTFIYLYILILHIGRSVRHRTLLRIMKVDSMTTTKKSYAD